MPSARGWPYFSVPALLSRVTTSLAANAPASHAHDVQANRRGTCWLICRVGVLRWLPIAEQQGK